MSSLHPGRGVGDPFKRAVSLAGGAASSGTDAVRDSGSCASWIAIGVLRSLRDARRRLETANTTTDKSDNG
jgi:hypothetical protein